MWFDELGSKDVHLVIVTLLCVLFYMVYVLLLFFYSVRFFPLLFCSFISSLCAYHCCRYFSRHRMDEVKQQNSWYHTPNWYIHEYIFNYWCANVDGNVEHYHFIHGLIYVMLSAMRYWLGNVLWLLPHLDFLM